MARGQGAIGPVNYSIDIDAEVREHPMDDASIEARLTAIEDRLGMEAGLRPLSTATCPASSRGRRRRAISFRPWPSTQSQHTEELATHTGLLRSAHTKLDLLVTTLGRLSGDPEDEHPR